MRKLFWLLISVLALSGCTALPRETGFELASPRQDIAERRQEPWHNAVLPGDLSAVSGYQVAVVILPQPMPEVWQREFIDPTRVYTIRIGERRTKRPLERAVLRAALYDETGRLTGLAPAVVGPQMNAFFVLLPVTERHEGRFALILSSDGKRAFTAAGAPVSVAGEDLGRLRPEFLAEHPSRIVQTVAMWRFDPSGKQFLDDLEERFPTRLVFAGEKYSGMARETLLGLSSLTRNDRPIDCLISDGRLSVFPGMTAVSLVFSLPRNLMVLSECGK